MSSSHDDQLFMACALALATQGEGSVEPNPMVGCVIVRDGNVVGEGYHEQFGGPHAEVIALEQAGANARGATAYVTLEPCCHYGKTPPCTEALIKAGIARVVVAVEDPFHEVAGNGLSELRVAGIRCDVGIHAEEARAILAPYRKLISTGRPWVIAKYAMTLDGKLATRAGDSQWISSEASRAIVHQIRGRVDAVIVGSGTAKRDDPVLTARPMNLADIKRRATRIVFDSSASLSPESRLVRSAADVPVIVATASGAPPENLQSLENRGVEVLRLEGESHSDRLERLLAELGQRRMTNVLVEGGAGLLGTMFDLGAIDEIHVFIAPKFVGGTTAPSPIQGIGVETMRGARTFAEIAIEEVGGDVYIRGRLKN